MAVTSDNKVLFGLKNINVFSLTETENQGAITMSYGSAIRVPGAVDITLNIQEGNQDPFYADDSVYYLPALTSNGYDGNVTLADLPVDVRTALMPYMLDDDNVVIEQRSKEPQYFGMTFEIDGDVKARRFVYYKCSFGRPTVSGSTKTDSSTPTTVSVPIKVLPTSKLFEIGSDTNPQSVISGFTLPGTDSDVYSAWHTTPHLPTKTTPPGP